MSDLSLLYAALARGVEMAPGNPLTTYRLLANYSGPRGSHVMLFRGDRNAELATFVADVRTLITEMAITQWAGTTWSDASLAEPDVEFSFPLAWDPIVAPVGNNPAADDPEGVFAQFGARASNGRRVKLYLFETAWPIPITSRYQAGAVGVLDDVVAACNDAYVLGSLRTIDNGTPLGFYPYINMGINDYLMTQARQ